MKAAEGAVREGKQGSSKDGGSRGATQAEEVREQHRCKQQWEQHR
jgi:hypothetical protein